MLVPHPPETSLVKKAIALWLSDKTSAMTRREYQKDLRYFFTTMANAPMSEPIVWQFLQVTQSQANAALLAYKGNLIEQGLAPSTINRRLSAVKSFISTANRLGICQFSLKEAVKSEPLKPYRDTSGISSQQFKKVVALCDRSTIMGKRDYALLVLLWLTALRRNEVSLLNIGDFDADHRRLWLIGKGHTEKIPIDLSAMMMDAFWDWLSVRESPSPDDPLFIALDYSCKGHRLTGDGIYKLVRRYCHRAGIEKIMSPHRIRHSSLTAALDKTNGDVRAVQKLSRHKNLNTLMIYDDNRSKVQLELSEILENEL